MDPYSGETYNLGVKAERERAERDLAETGRTLADLVRLSGPDDAVQQVVRAVRSQVERDKAKAKRKAARAARKRNR